jgi:hypothetical protein
MIRMRMQVVVVDDAGGQQGVHEVAGIDRDRLCPAGLGLSLAEAKQITGGVQQILAGFRSRSGRRIIVPVPIVASHAR